METKLDSRRLAGMSKADGPAGHDFLLANLRLYEGTGAMAKALKATGVSIRSECAREGIVGVKSRRLTDRGAPTETV